MKQIIQTGAVPQGGWKYREPTTGVQFTHNNFLALMQQIRAHRDANGLPTHSGWAEVVHDEICQQNEGVGCLEAGGVERSFTGDDVKRFIATILEMRGELVSEEEQKRRLNICGKCPKKGVINCSGCGWLAGKITELLGGRSLYKPDEFFKTSCLACGCDIPAKTAIPLDVLKRADERLEMTPDYHERCWMRE